jgi:cobalt/nickel transport system permease protein
MTTKYNHQSYIVSKVLPYPIDQIMLLAYRFTFLALDGLEETIIAMRSRGGFNISGLQKNGRFYGAVFALAFIRSFDRADRVSKAMESRGYNGRLMSIYRPPNPSPTGYISLLMLLGLSVYVLVTSSGILHS